MVSTHLRRFSRRDGTAANLTGQRIAILGYGNLGRSFALNMRDAREARLSRLVVGNQDDDFADRARSDGFTVRGIAEASGAADIVFVLLPDEVIPEVFAGAIAPRLKPGAAVVFASGYALAYGLIHPPQTVDVLLLAPRMGGEQIRRRHEAGQGFHAFVSVEKDASGKAWQRLLALADAVGALRWGVFELGAKQEADLDLFIEQTLGAMVGFAVMNAFAVGVENGLPPEALVLEMYGSGEMESVWRGFRKDGFHRSAAAHGPTAMFGGALRTMDLMQTDLYERFAATMAEITSGAFAAQFQAERTAGYPVLSQVQGLIGPGPMQEAEDRIREKVQAPEARTA